MMEFKSLEQREVLLDTLQQIREAIINLQKWNEGIEDFNQLVHSSYGMQDLAGNCMMIAVIGEEFRHVDRMTEGELLPLRPEIPWKQVFGLRNRIVHGYFDIDIDVIAMVIKDDLPPLLEATDALIGMVSQ